jgi:hypothetical protein
MLVDAILRVRVGIRNREIVREGRRGSGGLVYCLGVTAGGMPEGVVGGVQGGHIERETGSSARTRRGYDTWEKDRRRRARRRNAALMTCDGGC